MILIKYILKKEDTNIVVLLSMGICIVDKGFVSFLGLFNVLPCTPYPPP